MCFKMTSCIFVILFFTFFFFCYKGPILKLNLLLIASSEGNLKSILQLLSIQSIPTTSSWQNVLKKLKRPIIYEM